MERLTKRELIELKDGQKIVACNSKGDECNDYCIYGYCKWNNEALKKLKAYEDAEEQGLLKRLPCKIGDIVYEIAGYCWDCGEQTSYCHLNCKKPKYRIRKWNVESFEIGCTLRLHGIGGKSGIFNKTVFLTEEEAAAELERVDKK